MAVWGHLLGLCAAHQEMELIYLSFESRLAERLHLVTTRQQSWHCWATTLCLPGLHRLNVESKSTTVKWKSLSQPPWGQESHQQGNTHGECWKAPQEPSCWLLLPGVSYSCPPTTIRDSLGSVQGRWPAVVLSSLKIAALHTVVWIQETPHAYMHINVLYHVIQQAQVGTGKGWRDHAVLFSSVYPAVGIEGTKQEMPWWFGILCLGLMQPV